MKRHRWWRWLRRLVLGVLAVLLWLGIVAVWIVRFGDSDRARQADCAIVLGAAAYGRKPSPVFAERINHAVDLYRRGVVKRLLFTGGSVIAEDESESSVARAYAVAAGVPARDILTESASRTTTQNLREAQQVMKANGLSSAIIVSDPLHLKRADAIASSLRMDAVTSPTPTSRYRSWKVRSSFLMREVFYLHGYWITGK